MTEPPATERPAAEPSEAEAPTDPAPETPSSPSGRSPVWRAAGLVVLALGMLVGFARGGRALLRGGRPRLIRGA